MIDFDIMREDGFFNHSLREIKKDIDAIDEVGWKKVECCPVCGNTEKMVLFTTQYSEYMYCVRCRCCYSNNISKETNTGRYTTSTFEEIESRPSEKKREYRKSRFAQERISLLSEYSRKPLCECSLLDVGCSTGFFLEEAKPFFSYVEGQELDSLTAQYVEQKYEIRVHDCDIKELTGKYDIITVFDVLEHIEHPLIFLSFLKRLLNRDGILLVFTTNWESLSFQVLPHKQNNHLYPCHLVFSTHETAEYYSERLNMGLELCCTNGMDIYDILAHERDILGVDIYKTLQYKYVSYIQSAIDKVGKANSLRMVLRNV